MKLRDIVEEVTQEQMRLRNYHAGLDAAEIDVKSGQTNRLQGREPRTDYERGYQDGYKRFAEELKRAGRKSPERMVKVAA